VPQHDQTKQRVVLRLYSKEKREIGQKGPSAIFLKTRKIELQMSGIFEFNNFNTLEYMDPNIYGK
jgi:hypothetical protein